MEKIILIILDGWGIGKVSKADAILHASTPIIDKLMAKFNCATLTTFGEAVGLPLNQMGNSEVGHLNIGAGRVVQQALARINAMAQNNEFVENKTLKNAAQKAISGKVPFHLMGLLSNGGIHSHINHLKSIIKALYEMGVPQIYVHAFLDGRDTDPKSGIEFIKDIEIFNKDYNTELVSVIGRYYAMDRDKRWERIKKAYDLMINGLGNKVTNFADAIQQLYSNNITDEFMEPLIKVNVNGETINQIKEGDVVACFNFRTDRCRQLSNVLTQNNFPAYEMQQLNLQYYTLTEYDETFKNVSVILQKEDIPQTLGEIIAEQGFKQLRMAETEKYPHVTYFFSGGREAQFEGEERILVHSPKVATYDLQPEMSALDVTDKLINSIKQNKFDFIVINYANTDMVGHTGVFEAAKKAAQTVDDCVGKVVEVCSEHHYLPIIIADHGNADFMINADGSPNTAHTTNLVPLIVCDPNYKSTNGKLADLAPSILSLMNSPIPAAMTGNIIIKRTDDTL